MKNLDIFGNNILLHANFFTFLLVYLFLYKFFRYTWLVIKSTKIQLRFVSFYIFRAIIYIYFLYNL